MIVDLLRNDISKTLQKGSVKVPVIFNVESYATVHHLVSTVTGILAEGPARIGLVKKLLPWRVNNRRAQNSCHGNY
jgi:para-aminobenzoate synthetase component 1